MTRFAISTAVALILIGTALAEPLEHSMASINAGHSVKADDVTVVRFRFLLKELHDASGEQPEQIKDMLVKGQNILTAVYGKKITLLEFTEAAYKKKHLVLSQGMQFQMLLSTLIVDIAHQ
jgi:hypothetical protein